MPQKEIFTAKINMVLMYLLTLISYNFWLNL